MLLRYSMSSKLKQRYPRLTLCLSVMFVIGYMHEIAAQYNAHNHCGCESVASVKSFPGADNSLGLLNSSSDQSNTQPSTIPAGGCNHAPCTPSAATSIIPFSQSENVISCSRLLQPSFLVPASQSKGIDHPPDKG